MDVLKKTVEEFNESDRGMSDAVGVLSFRGYAAQLSSVLESYDWSIIEPLAKAIRQAWQDNKQVFLCGNGGSAANAIHIANDFLFGVAPEEKGIKVCALPANSAILTCLANDIGYEKIYAHQLTVQASKDDVLIVLSGSGNSENIVCALEQAKNIGMHSFAILGFSGGKCLSLADHPIHFNVADMQISEDLQVIVGHMLMKWLCANPVT